MRRGFGSRSLILVLGLVLGACSPGPDGASTDNVEPEGETLQDFIPGASGFDPENAQVQYRQQEQNAQEQIAACMAEHGFEYIPHVQNLDDVLYVGADSEDEFAKEYGLGITYDVLKQKRSDEDKPLAELANDPNHEIQRSLSPKEAEAYFRALHGTEPDIDSETMTEEEIEAFFQGFDPGGCQNEAYESFFENQSAVEFYDEFGDQLDDMYQRAQADPRIAELRSNWSECMSEAGYDFENEEDASIFIARRLEEVNAIFDLEIDSHGGWSYSSKPIESGSDTYRAAEAILSEEIAIATLSLTCRGDVEDVYRAVFAEYEQEFIRQNRVSLERFRDQNP